MQISGEPFAEAMGRDLGGYSRDFVCQLSACAAEHLLRPRAQRRRRRRAERPHRPRGLRQRRRVVRVLEAADEQPRVRVGRGDLARLRPRPQPRAARRARMRSSGLRAWVQHAAVAGQHDRAHRHAPTSPRPTPSGGPASGRRSSPSRSGIPTIHASNASTGCTISSDDDPGASGALECDDYECDYTTLHLPDRAAQVNMTIGPGASGWAGWKEALWTLNYLQVMHDTGRERASTPCRTTSSRSSARAATRSSATAGAGVATVPGTFLGSSDIEGFQAANFLQILDNQAQQWLTAADDDRRCHPRRASRASRTRSPTPTRARSRWFPGSDRRHRERRTTAASRGPSGYAIASPDSDLLDLAGLLGAFSSIYALTDQSNAQVGGIAAGARVLRRRSRSRPEPDADRRADASRPGARDDARARREHGRASTSIRRPGMFVDDVTLAGGNVVARDDALDRHGRLRAPLAADGAPRARLAARALQQHEARRRTGSRARSTRSRRCRGRRSARGSTRSSRRSRTSSTTS